MICLMILILLGCQSTNYYEAVGIKNELFTRKQGNSIADTVNNRTNDRTHNNNEEVEEKIATFMEGRIREEEVSKMEDINSIVTALGSAIAGVYCLIKTIIAAIKKVKKN